LKNIELYFSRCFVIFLNKNGHNKKVSEFGEGYMTTVKSKRQELIDQIKTDLNIMENICKEADKLLLEFATFTNELL
jgi:uncharacterized metal-binding protein